MIIYLRYLSLVTLLISQQLIAADVQQPPVGNFALPVSQQPYLFYSFGSNLIDKGQLLITENPDVFKATGERYLETSTSFLYGINENNSLLMTVPSTFEYKAGEKHYRGFGDLSFQQEHALYTHNTKSQQFQVASILGFSVPSGSKNLTYETPSFFFAGSVNELTESWAYFFAPGVLVFEGPRAIRLGNIYYYELGFGKNLKSETGKYIFDIFFEINGQFNEKNPGGFVGPKSTNGTVLSDGYLHFITSALWFSTKHWAYQFGISYPYSQNWNDGTGKVNYYVSGAVTYTMNGID